MFITLIVSSIFFGVVTYYSFSRNKLALYHPLFIFILWHFMGYVLIPWHLYFLDDWSYFSVRDIPIDHEWYLIKPLILANLGLISVVIGYFFHTGSRWSSKTRLRPILLNPQTVFTVGIPFLILAAYSIHTYYGIAGITDPSSNAMDPRGTGQFTQTTAYIAFGSLYLMGLLPVFYLLARTLQNNSWRLFTWVIIFGYLIFTMLHGWSRSSWVLLLLSLLTMDLILRKRSWPPWRWVLLAVPLFLVFNISGMDRDAWRNLIRGRGTITNYAEGAETRVKETYMSADISTYENNIIQGYFYPEKIDFEWGRIYYNRWIAGALPRVIFNNKDEYFLELHYNKVPTWYSYGSVSGLYFDFYRNFGVIGLVLLSIIFGISLKILWAILGLYKYQGKLYQYIILIYCGIISGLPMILRDGTSTLIERYFFILGPISIILFFCRKNLAHSHLKMRKIVLTKRSYAPR